VAALGSPKHWGQTLFIACSCPPAFLFLGKFLRFVFDDFNLLPCEAVEFADQLVDLFVGRVDLALRPIDDYSAIGRLLRKLSK
jgi:DNA-binding transcriptional LysR family regulator